MPRQGQGNASEKSSKLFPQVRRVGKDCFGIRFAPRVRIMQKIISTPENETKTAEIIDHLIHEMENHLQVISMEAHVRQTSKREVGSVLDAAENIEKLLEKVRQQFLANR